MTENSKELVSLGMLLESILDGDSADHFGNPAVYCGETPEHVQNSTPETWSHPNTMRASGARALGGMFCNARVTHTAKLCTKDTGAKKQVLGQKSLCWTRKSHIGTLLPGDVNLHYRRQIEVDA